ncbi:MAG: flavin reductase family protein [Lachnospiraceae bacterium]|nr:flavin reductase family protein [Lachnospiraceae bacterium]
MHYSPAKDECPLARDPFKACVAPRPIAWISTVSEDGTDNLAPFSQFQIIGYSPALVMVAIKDTPDENGKSIHKDTLNNIESTRCFVYNAVTYELRESMNITGRDFPPEIDEFSKAGVHKTDSICIPAKRVEESPIQFECRCLQTLRIPGTDPSGIENTNIVIAEVVQIHIKDEFILPDGKLDYEKLKLLYRAGYTDYGVMENTFSMVVPGVDEAHVRAMEGQR